MENRKSARRRVITAGKILLDSGGVIDCRLHDHSDAGARVKVATLLGIPTLFTLLIETTQERRRAEMVWQKETEIGVHFI